MRVLIPLLLVLWTLLAVVALAEEQPPCAYVEGKSKVLCTIDGFKKLTTAVVNAEAKASSCSVRLEATETSRREAADALRSCVSVVPREPAPKSLLKPRLAVTLGTVGATAASVAAFSSVDPLSRAAVGVGGVLSIVVAYWLASTDG